MQTSVGENKMNILLIEDERPLALAVVAILTKAGYHVTWRHDGSEGYETARTGNYDLIILDVLLPHKSGWDICRDLRARDVNTAILILSAMDEPSDKTKGLDLGADDFMAKPFDTDELLARVRARLRKEMTHKGQVVRIDDLEIDRFNHRVRRGEREIVLTQSEFRVLDRMASLEGRSVKSELLADDAAFIPDPLADPLEHCIATLRHKIDAPFRLPLIHHTPDGYVLSASAM